MRLIPAPTMSEILREEFMITSNIDVLTIAENTGLNLQELREILSDRREIDLAASKKLGRFFGVSENFFLNIQREIQARNTVPELRYA